METVKGIADRREGKRVESMQRGMCKSFLVLPLPHTPRT